MKIFIAAAVLTRMNEMKSFAGVYVQRTPDQAYIAMCDDIERTENNGYLARSNNPWAIGPDDIRELDLSFVEWAASVVRGRHEKQ